MSRRQAEDSGATTFRRNDILALGPGFESPFATFMQVTLVAVLGDQYAVLVFCGFPYLPPLRYSPASGKDRRTMNYRLR